VGFYFGRLLSSLITSTVVLTALLAETTRLYAGAARANMLMGIVSASQAISSEIELSDLIKRMMTIMLQSSGADRAVLILPRSEEYRVEAEANVGKDVVLRSEPLIDAAVPVAIVRYVLGSREAVLMGDHSKSAQFSKDPYINQRNPRSALCLPLVWQDELGGVLYLESALIPRAFTTEHARLLELLASQAAISLQITRLYSDLKIRERELHEAHVQLSDGQRLSQTGSFTADIDQDQLRGSDEFYRIFDIEPKASARLSSIRACIHTDDVKFFDAQMERVTEGPGSDFIVRATTSKNGLKHLRIVRNIEHFEGRRFVFGTIQDITEIKLAETALNQTRSELAHVARVGTLNAMTASIAHEVSQPLSGILTNANTCIRLLAAVPPDLEVVTQAVRRTIRDGNRASEIILRLRTMLSKKETDAEEVDLNVAAREVIALSSAELQRARALLQTDFEENLPIVVGDRVQLQQVILNLLLNGAEAMTGVNDRPRTLVLKTAFDQDGNVILSIRDSGIGIDPSATAKLFETFYTTKPEGMGIGLSICRSIIEAHHGQIWVTPNERPGATFHFCVPSGAKNAHASENEIQTEAGSAL
jgi:signal transduction histidine kinase